MLRKSAAVKTVAAAVAVIIVIVLLLNPSVQGILRGILFDPFQESYPSYSTFTLERTLTVDANGGVIYNHTFDVPMPKTTWEGSAPLQQVINVSADPVPALENRYGSEWMVWRGEGPSGPMTSSVTVTYELTVSTFIWELDQAQSGTITDIPTALSDRYLGNEWRILVEEAPIQETAASIVGDQDNVLDVLRSIYDWIRVNIEYKSATTLPQTSVETLSSGQGDCDDQAVLFCALSRSVGIPAWLQLGVMYDPFFQEWGGHGWVQTYVPLEGGGVNVTIDTVNDDFLVWRPNRFADFTDDGIASHLEDYYYFFHCSYDPDSYPEGQTPEFVQDFEAIDYQESSDVVKPGDFSQLLPAPHIARKMSVSGS